MVKSYCSDAVNTNKATIRDSNELFSFCKEHLELENRSVEEGIMKNHIFFNITLEEVNEYREIHKINKFYPVTDARLIHQISNKLGCNRGIYHQIFSCCCNSCLQKSRCKYDQDDTTFSSDKSLIRPK